MIIPVAEPYLDKEEERLVLAGLRSGWISSIGQYIQQFEEEFAKYCNVKYGIAVANGTAALHLALVAADIGPGDEVIVPSLTFVATANAVTYTGAKPVFVDSEMESWNIDPEKIKEKITRKTKAIIPVHLYGQPANMEPVLNIGRKYKLLVIEDAAEAHGALYKKKKVGSLGDVSCFSFFGNKIITTGEGGMILTNNKVLARRIRMLRDHGASKRRPYYHSEVGFNYRMTNLQAAIGLGQLGKIDYIIERKKQIAQAYEYHLKELIPRIVFQPNLKWAEKVCWIFSLLILNEGKKTRNFLKVELKKRGIDSRPFFFPIHRLPHHKNNEHLPVADFLTNTGINLPSSVNLTDRQVKFICDNIINILNT